MGYASMLTSTRPTFGGGARSGHFFICGRELRHRADRVRARRAASINSEHAHALAVAAPPDRTRASSTGGNQMRNSVLKNAFLAAALAVSPAAALAQNDATVGTTDTTYAAPVQEDDDDFPWGLLGLLGLAGLLGLKKKERDIHVDARRNP
jgi:hypothetical protein